MRSNAWLSIGILSCIASQILIVYWSPLSDIFGTGAIEPSDWILAVAIASSVFFAIEIEKWFVRSGEARKMRSRPVI
jgi:hypothetical protein